MFGALQITATSSNLSTNRTHPLAGLPPPSPPPPAPTKPKKSSSKHQRKWSLSSFNPFVVLGRVKIGHWKTPTIFKHRVKAPERSPPPLIYQEKRMDPTRNVSPPTAFDRQLDGKLVVKTLDASSLTPPSSPQPSQSNELTRHEVLQKVRVVTLSLSDPFTNYRMFVGWY